MNERCCIGARASAAACGALLALVLAGAAGCAQDDRTAHAGADLGTREFAVRVCADGQTLSGIDVSYYQGTIDWTAVAAAGIKFAFIRASDAFFEDPKFAENWAGAKRAGVVRGAYQYFRPNRDPVAQADLLLRMMGTLDPGDLPPVIDVENTGGLSASAIVGKIRQWMTRVEGAVGRRPIIYTGFYFWRDEVGGATDWADYPLWIAQYGPTCPDLPAPWTDWVFFQTSDSGRVRGISGNVDTDLFNGDMAALLDFAAATVECGDGYCNGGETHATCPGDCPVCEPVPPAGRIVEENELCFEAGGPAQYWRRESAGSGGSLLWTHTTSDSAPANFGVWHLDLQEAGSYLVEAFTPAPWAESRRAVYQVRHAGATDRQPVDQTAVNGWSRVGEYSFAAGAGQWVRIDDNTGEAGSTNTQLVADGLRLTRVSHPVEAQEEPFPEGEGTGTEDFPEEAAPEPPPEGFPDAADLTGEPGTPDAAPDVPPPMDAAETEAPGPPGTGALESGCACAIAV